MKTLYQSILEKLILSKTNNRINKKYFPKTESKLKSIITDKIKDNNKVINVSDIDTSEITNFANLFEGCNTLEEIIGLDTWDTSNVEYLTEMFRRCNSLKNIDLSTWDVNKCYYFRGMFQDCEKLENIGDISDWELPNTNSIDMSAMFANCKKLESIDISKWDVSKVYWFSNVFTGCTNLISVGDLSNLNLENVYSFAGLFSGCAKLNFIGDISNWNIRSCKHMPNMFKGCVSLYSVGNIGKWKMHNILDIESMFEDCTKLKCDVSNWQLNKRCMTTGAFKYVDRKIFKKCKI
jgi:surface protein